MNATNKQGHVWNGERDDGWFIYIDECGGLYASREVPCYRIALDNAMWTIVNGKPVIVPKSGLDNIPVF